MNGKFVISYALLALLIVANLDGTDACKKCGMNMCNCLPHHPGLHHHHGFGGFAIAPPAISIAPPAISVMPQPMPPPICLPQLPVPQPFDIHPGHGHGHGHYHWGNQYPLCNICGGYTGAYNYLPRRCHFWKNRCRCY